MIDAETRAPEGLRGRKRRETRARIRQAALRLFQARGYEAVSLDEIAIAADVSRRSIFNHFASKDDILLGAYNDLADEVVATFADQPPGPLLDRAREAFTRLGERLDGTEAASIRALVNASATLTGPRGAVERALEKRLFDLSRNPAAPEDAAALQLAAIVAVGVYRVSLEGWVRGVGSFSSRVEAAFEALGDTAGPSRAPSGRTGQGEGAGHRQPDPSARPIRR